MGSPFAPENLIRTIIWVNAVLFAVSLVFSGTGTGLTLNPFNALSPATNVLSFLGASGRFPIERYHAWWTLFTATWLHGSLLHILFNMMALSTVGRYVIREFGSYRTFSIYTLSGAAGFLASAFLGKVGLTLGASAGLCGLIGALLFFGKSRGGQWGRLVVQQTSGWIVSLVLVGLMVPRIDNWGHGGGFLGGMALAWVMGYLDRNRETLWDKGLALTLAALILILLLRSVMSGFLLIFA